ncbi:MULTISPECIES: hypothetical protein [Enterococcus]|uniref:Uncharacterized protein n=1 Tax=Enterococcus sulfureus ATCC 49903 TaxID=1140003 RepID=S0L8B3_9ENTE|nr:hypothetical protein [Enterococcus sulfureus]EOT47741.1 hypothetical protein OMY_01115 [Enterococcus sulfureus ATCC 49903]EOT83838.1 hypothetical protein I573_01563 [Enterococcus sulfureus ATCC 49903]
MEEKQNNVLIHGIFEYLDIPDAIAQETIQENVVYCYENGSWTHHEHEQEIIQATMELGFRPFLLIQQDQEVVVLYVDKLVENADAIKETQKQAHERVSQWLKDAEEECYHVLVFSDNQLVDPVQKEVVIRKNASQSFSIL